jgi:hypothetical protein
MKNGEFNQEATAAYPALTRAAMIICWSFNDVEDVVQETLLKATMENPDAVMAPYLMGIRKTSNSTARGPVTSRLSTC